MFLLYFLGLFVSFYVGVLFGGHDMKKAYGIDVGVDEFKDTYIKVETVEENIND